MGVRGGQVMSSGGAPRDEDSSTTLLPPPSLAPTHAATPTPSPAPSATTPAPSSRVSSRRGGGAPLSLLTVALWVLVALVAALAPPAAALPQARDRVNMGESSRMLSCPSANEIQPCTCRVMKKKGLDISCDHADEKHVRNALDVLKKKPFTIFWMKFRNCKLPRIPDYVFLGLDVRHLNIIRSNVTVIERSSLSALGSTLQSLDLANNDIGAVPTGAFSMLKMLEYLNLNYNHIKSLEEGAFSGLTALTRLTLYDNKIQHIHNNAFKDIGRKLLRLNLGRNNLDDIPTDAFHPLHNLEVLDLHENRIRHIPDAAFQGLRKLDMLKLEHNYLTTIQDNVFGDLTVLNSLNVEHNHIENISDGAFAGLESSLEWLELGHNRLDHIPSHALRPLHNLRQLDLESNKIQDVQEDAFRGYGDTVKYILLDKNRIKRIPNVAFEDLHSLEWLKLSHNEITALTMETVQPILDTVTMIDVSKNPLTCNCDLMWLKTWLSNPNRNDGASEETECITQGDHTAHAIKTLSESDFDCPSRPPSTQLVTSPDGSVMMVCSPFLLAAALAVVLV